VAGKGPRCTSWPKENSVSPVRKVPRPGPGAKPGRIRQISVLHGGRRPVARSDWRESTRRPRSRPPRRAKTERQTASAGQGRRAKGPAPEARRPPPKARGPGPLRRRPLPPEPPARAPSWAAAAPPGRRQPARPAPAPGRNAWSEARPRARSPPRVPPRVGNNPFLPRLSRSTGRFPRPQAPRPGAPRPRHGRRATMPPRPGGFPSRPHPVVPGGPRPRSRRRPARPRWAVVPVAKHRWPSQVAPAAAAGGNYRGGGGPQQGGPGGGGRCPRQGGGYRGRPGGGVWVAVLVSVAAPAGAFGRPGVARRSVAASPKRGENAAEYENMQAPRRRRAYGSRTANGGDHPARAGVPR